MRRVALPHRFPLVRHRLHSPRSRRVRACAPEASVKGRRVGRLEGGCLDWRVSWRATLSCIGSKVGTREYCLVSCGDYRNPATGHGAWFASGVLAPALSEPKARSRAPARRLCDGVRRSRPTPCRQPEHRSHQTRSAAATSFATCIIENAILGKVAARGRATSPTKRGRIVRKKELSGLALVQVRRTPVVPLIWSKSIFGIGRFLAMLLIAIFLFYRCISQLGIIYMSILRCVFLYRESG